MIIPKWIFVESRDRNHPDSKSKTKVTYWCGWQCWCMNRWGRRVRKDKVGPICGFWMMMIKT